MSQPHISHHRPKKRQKTSQNLTPKNKKIAIHSAFDTVYLIPIALVVSAQCAFKVCLFVVLYTNAYVADLSVSFGERLLSEKQGHTSACGKMGCTHLWFYVDKLVGIYQMLKLRHQA